MRRLAWLVLCGALAACTPSPTVLTPASATLATQLPRYGLNLGGSGTWGAEQLRANILTNPGFEPILERSLVVTARADGRRIVDDTDWVARAPGFWSGAQVDVRSGLRAGQGGQVLESRRLPDGRTELLTDPALPGIAPGDVLVLSHGADPAPAPGWWFGPGRFGVERVLLRPGSPGRQAVRLLAAPGQPAELLHYSDNIAARAGKLLPVQGRWRLAFWARARAQPARLDLHFGRAGQPAFVRQSVPLDSGWRLVEHVFDARDDGPPGVLTLSLRASDAEVLLDDIYLGEAEAGPGGFRQVAVETLRRLRPGFLRDWQGQLGDTLDNRLATEHAHRPARYRAGKHEAQFHYGLPDFLALCAAVGAQPWVVAPTTLDDAEWRRLGAYLRHAAQAYGFQQIMLEFGNENWNPLFRPAAIPQAASHAAVAGRAFRLVAEGSGADRRLVPVVNAQFVNPDSPQQAGALTAQAERVAVAPYFLYQLGAGQTLDQARDSALNEDGSLLLQEAEQARRQGKQLAVYEVNLHTTLGDAGPAVRDAVVSGGASGVALARRLLQASLAGVREQAVYTFSGFDNYLQEGQGLVRLWGITRDLGSVARLRPTGIALGMLNRVAGGRAHPMRCDGAACADLTALGFDGARLALVSSARQAQEIEIALACQAGTLVGAQLEGSDAAANNEGAVQVRARDISVPCSGGRARLRLPPASLTILHPAPQFSNSLPLRHNPAAPAS